ncbi:hypothetical protein [Nocardia sp. NPDC051570]|uniref:hypothetical protein n=1 Tax=Nocardia sp. NPDC051570 TaxID=3364324 RepID=UPI0037917E63
MAIELISGYRTYIASGELEVNGSHAALGYTPIPPSAISFQSYTGGSYAAE